MRFQFRLSTLLATTLAVAFVLMMNLSKRSIPGGWEEGSEFEPPTFTPEFQVSYGWPAVVYERRETSTGRRVTWEPWAIAVNVVGCAALIVGATAGAELAARRQSNCRMKRSAS